MAAKDMWGDFQLEAIRTPVQILREQAAALGPKTRNLVIAEVNTSASSPRFDFEEKLFTHQLKLVVPSLDDYRFSLLSLSHDIELYPVSFEYLANGVKMDVASEEELNEVLQKFLSAPKTKRIISSLLGQVSSIAS